MHVSVHTCYLVGTCVCDCLLHAVCAHIGFNFCSEPPTAHRKRIFLSDKENQAPGGVKPTRKPVFPAQSGGCDSKDKRLLWTQVSLGSCP